MATAAIPTTFSNGTNADANQVNGNFSYLVNWLNTYVIQPDTAVFTVFPTLPSSDPSNAYHAAHKNYVDNWFPAGSIIQYAGATAPSGWVFCDGASYDGSNPIYSRLYGVISTLYGGSAPSFQVPDLRGRVPVGRQAGDTEFGNLNNKGGAKTHALSSSEVGVVSHSHTATSTSSGATTIGSDGTHSHTQSNNSNLENHAHNNSARTIASGTHGHTLTGDVAAGISGGTQININTGPSPSLLTTTIDNAGLHSHTATTTVTTTTTVNPATAVAATAHNNLQPYIAVNFIIKL